MSRLSRRSCKESQQEAEERFLPWLESAILRSLELWKSNVL